MQLILVVWALSLISQLGRHFWPKYAFVGGLPIDYLSITLYVSEILTFSLLVLFHKQIRAKLKPQLAFLYLMLVLANIFFAFNPPLAIFYWLKFGLLAGMVIFVFRLKDDQLNAVSLGLRLGIIATFILAFGQMILQHSWGGLWYWIGERQFALMTPGIARLQWFGRVLLRPYGSFSHPNSLAGFALVTMIILSVIRSLERGSRLFAFLLAALILLTGSRVTIFASLVFVVLQAINNRKLAHKLNWVAIGTAGSITLALLVVPANMVGGQSLQQRLVLAQTQMETLRHTPLMGTGLGNSIPATYFFSPDYRFNLWYQPVHNVWLLLLVEMGIPGLLLATWGWLKLQRTLLSHNLLVWWSGWQAILITSLFDHYWLTLPQNRLILALYLGLTLRALAAKTNIMKG